MGIIRFKHNGITFHGRDDHLPQDGQRMISELKWIMARHLNAEANRRALNIAGHFKHWLISYCKRTNQYPLIVNAAFSSMMVESEEKLPEAERLAAIAYDREKTLELIEILLRDYEGRPNASRDYFNQGVGFYRVTHWNPQGDQADLEEEIEHALQQQ